MRLASITGLTDVLGSMSALLISKRPLKPGAELPAAAAVWAPEPFRVCHAWSGRISNPCWMVVELLLPCIMSFGIQQPVAGDQQSAFLPQIREQSHAGKLHLCRVCTSNSCSLSCSSTQQRLWAPWSLHCKMLVCPVCARI